MTDYHKKTKTELICELNNALDALAICSHGPAVIRMQKQNAELQKQLVDKVEYCHTAEANFDLTTKKIDELRSEVDKLKTESKRLQLEKTQIESESITLKGVVAGLEKAHQAALEAIK